MRSLVYLDYNYCLNLESLIPPQLCDMTEVENSSDSHASEAHHGNENLELRDVPSQDDIRSNHSVTMADDNRNREVVSDSGRRSRSRVNYTQSDDFPLGSSGRTRWHTCNSFGEALLTFLPANALSLVAIMAACNSGSLAFHLYATIWWICKNNTSCCGGKNPLLWLVSICIFGPGGTLEVQARIIWMWLMAQLIVGSCKLFFRFNTKRRCLILVTFSDYDEQQEGMRNIVESVSFRVHASLGRIAQVLNIIGHILYFVLGIGNMQFDEKVSLLRLSFMRRIGTMEEVFYNNTYLSGAVLLDVCCTNIVIGLFRALVSIYVLHSYSLLDQVQRRKKIKTTFTDSEINRVVRKEKFCSSISHLDSSCSICLETFRDGEEIAMLPCDDRHSFHYQCIKTWLSRQNTCPLCQVRLSRFCK